VAEVRSLLVDHYGEVTLPPLESLLNRRAILSLQHSQLILRVVKLSNQDSVLGFNSTDVKGWWSRPLDGYRDATPVRNIVEDTVRSLQSTDRKPIGHLLKSDNGGHWEYQNQSSCLYALMAKGLSKQEAQIELGNAALKQWTNVCIPFGPEYPNPGEYQWNMHAPQFAVEPVEGLHPHWDLIHAHGGASLGVELRRLKHDGIETGSDYLRQWLACVIRKPFNRLPFLLFYGDQNDGKSIFHESFSLMVTSGVVDAYRALKEQFNGVMEGAILCTLDERNASEKASAEKIKSYTTSNEIEIRRMRAEAYTVANTTHWCQMTNSLENACVPLGDTRTTMIKVGTLQKEIPKDRLLDALQAEAPAMLFTLLHLDLIEPNGRMQVPVITTVDKLQHSKNYVSLWIAENMEFCPGPFVGASEIYARFGKVDKPRKEEFSTILLAAGAKSTTRSSAKGFINVRLLSEEEIEKKKPAEEE